MLKPEPNTVRLVSWNVNGLRACARKGFLSWLQRDQPDIVALQEVRALPEQLDPELFRPDGYSAHWNPATRKGYSGVGLLSKQLPLSVETQAMNEPSYDSEGRLIVSDHGDFLLYSVYFPNGGQDLQRVPYKLEFSEAVLQHAGRARAAGRSVVICGDFNTAHQEIDLANPRSNTGNTGFLPEERAWVSRVLDRGWIDIFRTLHPDEPGHYTWWSNRRGVRERNIGWRIDYYLISPDLAPRVVSANHQTDVLGSDHCPIELVLQSNSRSQP
jgi:exodeoxyribonuclease-3